MGFLTPFALFFAALGIPIVIMYMLKLRRQDVLVSSTLLWQRLLRDREANAPWQRLRRNLLLLLQLLILVLLTLAMARPFVPAPALVSGSVVVLLDGSASMQARDVIPTRFDAAVRVAREVVSGLGTGDVATLITVGSQPQVLAAATNDRALLRRALDGAVVTNGSADWEAAFALTAAGLTGARETQVVVISDGALPDGLPALPAPVRFVGVGGGRDNLALAAFATRASATGPQAFVRVANYGERDAEPLIEFSADGVLFDARRLPVPAGGRADLTLYDLPYDVQVMQARLVVEDALPLDDSAWAVHTPAAGGRVLLVSAGNLFLERALSALPGVELVRLSPDQPLPTEPYDLTIYDGVVTGTLPSGNLWFIGPPTSIGAAPGLSLVVGGVFTDTALVSLLADDALLRYVDWSDVHVMEARMVQRPPGARVLVEAQGGPLLFVADRPEGRLAVLTFDLHDSDLPLQVAFPILVANLADWLLPQGSARLPDTVHPGEPVSIPFAPQATDVVVTTPDGERHTLRVTDRAPVFAATDHLGAYGVQQLDRSGTVLQSGVFAVSLFDEAESDIAPQETVYVGGAIVAGEMPAEEGRREYWPWIAGLVLVALSVEWWAYQRGSVLSLT